MSSYVLLHMFDSLLIDISRDSGVALRAPDSTGMDWVLKEGPGLDKTLLQFLEHGGNPPDFPEWLIPLWKLWLVCNDPKVLGYLRQILVFGYKSEFEPTNEQLDSACANFVETDRAIDAFNSYFTKEKTRPLFQEARKLVARVIASTNFRRIQPSHGPGAVFPPSVPSEKANFCTIYTSIETYYPFFEFFAATTSRIEEAIEKDDSVSYADNIVCKLVAVPKDSRGPRLISTQPKEAIWIQQGLRKSLETAITNSSLTRGYINFDDQRVNGLLALQSSKDRKYATLDLKEASDRLSSTMFDFLFGDQAKYFNACRAVSIVTLDGEIHQLRKYAPMGNASVFPVQSLCFWAMVRSAIQCYCGEICSDVYVFGDDIIYPSQYHEHVIQGLIRFGLVPNSGKTFHKGFFRESCGVDAYNGVDITPLKIKTVDYSSPSDLVSMCAFAKRLRIRGYWVASTSLYSYVRRVSHRRVAICNDVDCQGLVEYCDWPIHRIWDLDATFRWNKGLHRYEVSAFLTEPHYDVPDKCDWYHILDSLLLNTGDSRGVRYAFPRRSRLVRGWIPIKM